MIDQSGRQFGRVFSEALAGSEADKCIRDMIVPRNPEDEPFCSIFLCSFFSRCVEYLTEHGMH